MVETQERLKAEIADLKRQLHDALAIKVTHASDAFRRSPSLTSAEQEFNGITLAAKPPVAAIKGDSGMACFAFAQRAITALEGSGKKTTVDDDCFAGLLLNFSKHNLATLLPADVAKHFEQCLIDGIALDSEKEQVLIGEAIAWSVKVKRYRDTRNCEF